MWCTFDPKSLSEEFGFLVFLPLRALFWQTVTLHLFDKNCQTIRSLDSTFTMISVSLVSLWKSYIVQQIRRIVFHSQVHFWFHTSSVCFFWASHSFSLSLQLGKVYDKDRLECGMPFTPTLEVSAMPALSCVCWWECTTTWSLLGAFTICLHHSKTLFRIPAARDWIMVPYLRSVRRLAGRSTTGIAKPLMWPQPLTRVVDLSGILS